MTEDQPTQEPESAAPAGDDRESILAGMAELHKQPPADGEVDLTETTPADQAAQEAAAEEVDAEAEEEEETEEEPESEEEPAPDLKLDADLEKIQQAEKRSKERMSEHIASERAELAKEREEFATLLAEAKEIKADHAAAQRRAFDPKGKSSEQLMAEARRIHALAIAGDENADPAKRQAAQRTVKEQEIEERVAAAEKRAADIEAKWEARENEQADKANAERIASTSIAAITDETPLTRAALTGKGAKANTERLLNITAALYQQTGEMPDPVDVHKYFEEAERERLTDLGLDPDLVLKTSRKPKTKTPVAGEKTSAPTLTNGMQTSTQARTGPMTEEEERDDIIKGMSQL